MIVVKLIGGMGNQMFQYSYGKYLELVKNIDVFYDRDGFCDKEITSKRSYSLSCFCIKGKFINKYISFLFNVVRKLKNRNITLFSFYKDEDDLKDIESSGNNMYLDGYWQNYSYLQPIKNSIRGDFAFIKKISQKNTDLLEKNKHNDLVSIHVRRGDYVTDETVNKLIGTCNLSYYRMAISYILRKVNNPKFIIFSDDIHWCKNNLKVKRAEYVSWNQSGNSWQDMYLMSRCKHNIIANSSFSWWGAWLNNNPNKIVVAPHRWFRDKTAQKKAINLIPCEWVRL